LVWAGYGLGMVSLIFINPITLCHWFDRFQESRGFDPGPDPLLQDTRCGSHIFFEQDPVCRALFRSSSLVCSVWFSIWLCLTWVSIYTVALHIIVTYI
jgi:hypothetical protein